MLRAPNFQQNINVLHGTTHLGIKQIGWYSSYKSNFSQFSIFVSFNYALLVNFVRTDQIWKYAISYKIL